MDVGRFAAALETLQGLGPAADALRGRACFALARYEDAVTLLRAEDREQALMLVDALLALGRTEQAAAALEQAVTLPDLPPARTAVLQGRLAAAERRWADAVVAFERALSHDADDRAALFGLGQALLHVGRREEALATLERHRALLPLLDARDAALQALAMAPEHAGNLTALADAERALGRYDDALALYEHAAARAEGAEIVPIALRHARLLTEDRGAPDDAVDVLDETDRRWPDVRLRVRAGDVLLKAGRPAEALQRYERARELQPGDAAIAARLQRARELSERQP
jgi:tetratricopeptide (TPR) repeat protein